MPCMPQATEVRAWNPRVIVVHQSQRDILLNWRELASQFNRQPKCGRTWAAAPVKGIEEIGTSNRRLATACASARRVYLVRESRLSDLLFSQQRGDDGRQHRARDFLLGDFPKISF